MASYHSAANEGALVEALGASLGAMSLLGGQCAFTPDLGLYGALKGVGPLQKIRR